MTLRETLISRRDDILQRWAARARAALPETSTLTRLELDDNMPGILDEMASRLEPGQPMAARSPNAAEHGRQRLRVGFDAGAVVREYGLVHDTILVLVEEAGVRVSLAEHRALAEMVTSGISDAVTEYVAGRTRMLQLFIGVLGHDLRDPLSAIVTGAGTMLSAVDVPREAMLRIAGRIARGAQRMARQIEELIDLTRSGLGGITLERRWTDLGEVARAVVDEHETANPERTIRFEATGPSTGSWDPDRLARVVSNLVQNAIRHGSRSEPITVRLRGEEDHLDLEVHNFGEPIPEARIAAMFEPFYVHSETGTAGLGLGLYIVREIVRLHDGTIDVESVEGRGTTFRVRLPRRTV